MHGGYQVAISAIDPSAAGSPSFEGFTIQLRNGYYNGLPTNKSVLDDQVDTIFNGYLSVGGLKPQVPVTRIDISGYGESLFSNWLNPTDDAVAVSQASFDVLIGRTSYEVIQVRSVLYPYAVRVVRTITIFRKNTGGVVRKDSGWQAVSDGDVPVPRRRRSSRTRESCRRSSAVTNIQDTGQTIDTGGVLVAGVRFDGNLQIENTVKGGTSAGVPVRGQIGYVQLTPVASGSLTPAQYQRSSTRPARSGGPVDCVINLAGGGQLMKVGQVGVGVTQGMGGPEFVMTSWGSPQFPSGGQWSFLVQMGAGTAPEAIDQSLGVPLIRGGPAPSPPPVTSPYRFADPARSRAPDNPASDYGIVHATGTQRVFFPRPKIEATAPNKHHQHPDAHPRRSILTRHRSRLFPAHRFRHPVSEQQLRPGDHGHQLQAATALAELPSHGRTAHHRGSRHGPQLRRLFVRHRDHRHRHVTGGALVVRTEKRCQRDELRLARRSHAHRRRHHRRTPTPRPTSPTPRSSWAAHLVPSRT